jgi:methionyl-tRNA formyltransferase
VYLGTPDIAVPPLRALVAAGFQVVLVVSGPDKRRGRRGAPTPTPVKAAALELGLVVSEDPAQAAEVGADLGVVVAYGRILRRPLLDRLPMVNLHFSLLPRWRGAAPVERAILAGDPTTGVCMMAVEEGLDTGAVFAREEIPITHDVTAAALRAELTEIGAALLVQTLRRGLTDPEPQRGESTYAAKITPADLELCWDHPAVALHRQVRVGGAWTTRQGTRLKVHRARAHVDQVGAGGPGSLHGALVTTGAGMLELLEVQPEGKGRVAVEAWLNGARPAPGEVLGHAVVTP